MAVSRRIRLNKRILENKLPPDLRFTQVYALYSYRGDRLRWTTSTHCTAKKALEEMTLMNEVHKGLTWFGIVHPDDLERLGKLTPKERFPE